MTAVTSKKRFSAMPCGVAQALDVVGEWWTLLVLRDIFRGIRRFDDLQQSLGVASNVLTARLRRLVDEGIVERRAYQQRPPRYEYLLTDKGRALSPVMVGLMQWGERYYAGETSERVLVHTTCGEVTHPYLVCSACEQPTPPRELRAVVRSQLGEELVRIRERRSA